MRIWSAALALLILGCQGKSTFKELKYREQEMPAPQTDVKLPSKLWSLFENPNLEEKAETETFDQKPTEFLPIKVYLHERNKGILGGFNHELSFQAGGGDLDLKDFVTEKSGSFFIGFEADAKVPLDHLRVYFMSDSEERKLAGDVYGSGCNTYFEITSAFKKAMAKDGFLVNTTSQRHVSALAGTYFFVNEQGEKLYLTRLTIRDSRYPSLHCKKRLE